MEKVIATETIKGYKVFNPDWTCLDFQYEVGKTYVEECTPECCNVGFHFCTKPADCFNYYAFDSKNKVAEVEALGDVDKHGDDSKCSTNKIKIVRELSWDEVLRLVNTGDFNTGNRNTGYRNTGNRNTGDWNTGDYNTGSCNTGDWNKANRSIGCFCNRNTNKIPFFNKKSDWDYDTWLNSDARYLLNKIDFTPTEWIYESDMTEEEKIANPTYKTTGGYLKVRDTSDCCIEWWKKLSIGERNVILSLPNFDAKVFEDITGIDINKF